MIARRFPVRLRALDCSAGFTLLEMLVVLTVIMIISAISVPPIVGAISHAKIRGSATSLAGLVQSSRVQAIKRNETMTVRFVTRNTVPFAIASTADDTSLVTKAAGSEVQLGGSTFKVAVPSGDISALTNATLSYTPLNYPDEVSFNPRGLPCKYVAAGNCTTAGFVYYINDTTRPKVWAAVSISPGGRIKQWFWNGNGWGD